MGNNSETSSRKGLRGFAKGWTIFIIVYCASFAASLVRFLGDKGASAIIAPIILFSLVMVTGSAFMLKGRAYGFWILLAGSVLITLMNGVQSGNYTAIASGGLVLVVITFFITRKQLGILAKKDASDSIFPVISKTRLSSTAKIKIKFGLVFVEEIKNALREIMNGAHKYTSVSIPKKVVFITKGCRVIGSDLENMTRASEIALNRAADSVSSKYKIYKSEIFSKL